MNRHQSQETPDAPPPMWITAAQFAKLTGTSEQTLANWRLADRKAGRKEPLPGYPVYKLFGRSIRYLADSAKKSALNPTGTADLAREIAEGLFEIQRAAHIAAQRLLTVARDLAGETRE